MRSRKSGHRATILSRWSRLCRLLQFANSPDLKTELMNAIIAAVDAHTAMSSQALESERVREGLKDVLLGPAQLYENLRRQPPSE